MLTDSIDSSTTGRGSVVELVVMIKKQTLRTCNFLWSNVSQVLSIVQMNKSSGTYKALGTENK